MKKLRTLLNLKAYVPSLGEWRKLYDLSPEQMEEARQYHAQTILETQRLVEAIQEVLEEERLK